MIILVNGAERELVVSNDGIEWTNDLLGNYDALHYDEDTEQYTMSEDDFEWWAEICPRIEDIYERVAEADMTEEQHSECNHLDSCDLENWVEMAEDFLDNLK